MGKKNAARNKNIIRLYGEGKSCREISREIGLSAQAVINVLRSNNIEIIKRTSIKADIPMDVQNRIIDWFNSGITIREIHEREKLPKNRIHDVLVSNNIDTDMNHYKDISTPIEIQNIAIERYKNGDKIDSIREDLGLSLMTFYRILKRNSVGITHKHHRVTLDDKKKILELHENGKTSLEIAKTLDICIANVVRYKKELGV